MTFNPLSVFMSQHKLTGDNYIDWKRNLNTMLIAEGHSYVLVEPCPPNPPANASNEFEDSYLAWISSNDVARCCILASVPGVLQEKCQGMRTAAEIMESLETMFGKISMSSRHEAVKAIENSRMKEGASLREHLLVMMARFHEAEVHGACIDQLTKVNMVLQTLPASFIPFLTCFVRNKMDLDFTELMTELQTFEGLIKSKVEGEVNMDVVGSSSKERKKRISNKRKAKKKIVVETRICRGSILILKEALRRNNIYRRDYSLTCGFREHF